MRRTKSRILSVLLTLCMALTLLPTVALAADTRTPINTVEATSDITPVYGATIKRPTFTVTQGSPAYFSSIRWAKKIGTEWTQINSGTFTEGEWQCWAQVRIDGSEGTTHVLAAPLNVWVNGTSWLENGTPAVDDSYSYDQTSSPTYTVTAPSGMPLTFTDNAGFDIPNNQSGKAITAYSVASFVSGGTKPYTFSKTSGPDWITVSSAGQISGTPATLGTNADLVVRVTDHAGAYKEITISVGNTILKPGDRTPINTVEATSDITPVYGATIKRPTFTVTQGSPAYFSSIRWAKKIGTEWTQINSGTFTEGEWQCWAQVRIDGSEGTTHVLAAPLNVRVNGTSWLENGTPAVDDSYSYDQTSSPTYTVTATPLVFADSTAYDIPAGTVGESYTASTALTASGGKLPYVFTVAPAVDGLSIGSDNKLVYTRPTVADAKTATIKVTDDLGASKTITINIGAVTAAPETTYALTVTNGTDKTGGSPYAAGTEVSITANDPASGKQFKEWTTSNGGTFASATSASTTFTMPASATTVTATYEDIPASHTHAWESAWTNDATHHWHECAESGCPITENSEKGGYATHTASEWITVTPATETEAGTKHKVCTVCDYEMETGTIPATGSEHTHSYGSEWKNDATEHWHECTCGDKADVAAHVYDNAADTTCNVCGYVRTVAPATYALTVNLNGGNGGTVSGDYAESAVVSINAGTKSNYSFNGWTTSNGGIFANANSASTTFTMPGNATTITANWRYNGGGGGGGSSYDYYTITASAGANGTISPSGDFTIREGRDKTFTITANTGYVISDVLVDGKSVGSVKSYTFENIRKSHTIKATFVRAGQVNPQTGVDFPFEDVKESDWFYESVKYVFDKGLMAGTGDATFAPNITTSRGMIVTVLHRMEGSPAVTGANPFDDVAEGKWYADSIKWAAENKLVGGYGDGRFGPEDNITREQMAAILMNYAKHKGCDVSGKADLSKFSDANKISDWATAPLAWANAKGLISSTGGGVLDPKGETTRAQVAAILMRFCESYK